MTLVISRADLPHALKVENCIHAVAAAHAQMARGEVALPVRSYLQLPDDRGRVAIMPAVLSGASVMGMKIRSTIVDPDSGAASVGGFVVLQDLRNGEVLAIMDATYVTNLRTAAASALATKLMARPDSEVLGVLGAGVQARAHIDALRSVLPIKEVLVWSRQRATAEMLLVDAQSSGLSIVICDEPRQVVERADVVCTVTRSAKPVLLGAWLRPGMHVNAVGASTLDARELDGEAVARSRVVVDSLEAIVQESGDIMLAVDEGLFLLENVAGELGDLVTDRVPGRTSDTEITLYKSLGVAAQDVAAAHEAYVRARERGIGYDINI